MPILTVIAGCNGAGKSSYAKAISTNKLSSFDYNKVYLRVYYSLRDSELKERMSHNLAYKELEESVYQAIKNKTDFTYETNFNSEPLYWPEKFKKAGYQIRLIYFCLRSIKEAKRRVQIRVENGGHFVPESEINLRYKLGFENLNSKWGYFDDVYIFDTSTYNEEPKFLLSIANNKVDQFIEFPKYLNLLIPSIKNLFT